MNFVKKYLRMCTLIFVSCTGSDLQAQRLNLSNSGLKIVFVGVVNELSIELSDGGAIEFPYSITSSHGEMKRIDGKYYFFTFKSGDVIITLTNTITDDTVDFIRIKAIEIDDYKLSINPKFGHFWNINQFRIDSVSVSSKTLDLLVSVCYNVNAFKIVIFRNDKVVREFEIAGNSIDRKTLDIIKNLIHCDDKLVFHSFRMNVAGYKFDIEGELMRVLPCDGGD